MNRLDDPTAVSGAGFEPGEVAQAHAEILVDQVFEAGVCHADPIRGTSCCSPDAAALLDFGMVGRLDERTQRAFTRLLLGAPTRTRRP